MAAERTQSIESIAQHWRRFGRDEQRLPELAKKVIEHPGLPAVKGSAASLRLSQLQRVANAGSFEMQVRRLAEYHESVMRSRDQFAWLTVEENGIIKVHARTVSRPAEGTWPPGAWYNEYYLPQFKSFLAGMREGGV
jgi:hypothetical protein